MLLDGFEDGPRLFAVLRVTCEAEGDEQGFQCFWAIGVLESGRITLWGIPEDVTGVEEGVFVAAFQVREGSRG